MSIASIQSKYPSAIWFDSAHSGTESGTVDEPYNTISEAMTAASDGGVIAIKNGTHSQTSVTLPKSLTFVGESTEAILSTSGTGLSAGITASGTSYSITLETLKVTHSGAAHFGLIFGGTGDLSINGCVLDMTAVGGGTARGLFGFGNANVSGQSLTCTDSVLFTGATNGGWLSYYFPPDVDFQRNTIVILSGSSVSSVINSGGSGTVVWKNNIVYGNGQSETLTGLSLDTASNNCYYNTGISSGSGGVVFADPQFIDYTNKDLRLRPTSPCIGAGTAS